MKQISNLSELKQGDRICHIQKDAPYFYEFIMVHPKFPAKAMLLDIAEGEVVMIPTSQILRNNTWYIEVTLMREFYIKVIEILKKRIEDIEQFIKHCEEIEKN